LGWLTPYERTVLYMGPSFRASCASEPDLTLTEDDAEHAHELCFHLDDGCRMLNRACCKRHSHQSLGKLALPVHNPTHWVYLIPVRSSPTSALLGMCNVIGFLPAG
jgi:hypothetical protein